MSDEQDTLIICVTVKIIHVQQFLYLLLVTLNIVFSIKGVTCLHMLYWYSHSSNNKYKLPAIMDNTCDLIGFAKIRSISCSPVSFLFLHI